MLELFMAVLAALAVAAVPQWWLHRRRTKRLLADISKILERHRTWLEERGAPRGL